MRFKIINEGFSKEEKAQKIQQELERQIKIYDNLDGRLQAKLFPYLKQISFLSVMLDEKRAYLTAHGTLDKQQSSKGIWVEKISPAQDSYRELLIAYNEIQEQIEELIHG